MEKIVAGNWKMNLGVSSSVELATSLVDGLDKNTSITVWVAPSAQAFCQVREVTSKSIIQVGSQNVHWEEAGAFTGELSVPMLRECGCRFALTGHSERRHVFGESDELIVKRTLGSLAQNFTTILCVGETLAERESNKTEQVLEAQLTGVLSSATSEKLKHLVIAYEPVWAIGTGKVATPEEIAAAHSFIAGLVKEKSSGTELPILYGGSVSPDNFGNIVTIPHVGGALVGGASLSAEKFLALVNIAQAAQ
jgi:triosephosphate isomerase (TIM)